MLELVHDFNQYLDLCLEGYSVSILPKVLVQTS